MKVKDKHEAIGFVKGYDKAIEDILKFCEKNEGDAFKIVAGKIKELFEIGE